MYRLPHFTAALTLSCGIALLACTLGCERRYVGGPVAIVEGTPPEHGMLGVTFGEPPNDLVLTDVLVKGPAFQAGVQAGDEILSFNQQDVGALEDLQAAMQSTEPGDEVAIRVRRSGREAEFRVVLRDFDTLLTLKRRADRAERSVERAVKELQVAEPPHALEPADGPSSDGASSPPAQ